MGELKERFFLCTIMQYTEMAPICFCDGWRIPISLLHQHPQSSTAAMKVGFFSIP